MMKIKQAVCCWYKMCSAKTALEMFASPQLVGFPSRGCLVPGKTCYGAAICKSQANGPLTVRAWLQAQLEQAVEGLVLGAG